MDMSIQEVLHASQQNYVSFVEQNFTEWTLSEQNIYLAWQPQLLSNLQSERLQLQPPKIGDQLSLTTFPDMQQVISRLDTLESLSVQSLSHVPITPEFLQQVSEHMHNSLSQRLQDLQSGFNARFEGLENLSNGCMSSLTNYSQLLQSLIPLANRPDLDKMLSDLVYFIDKLPNWLQKIFWPNMLPRLVVRAIPHSRRKFPPLEFPTGQIFHDGK